MKEKKFYLLAGVLQGDTLAPYLFIIILSTDGKKHYPLAETEYDPIVLTYLDIADNIALVSESLEQAQIMVKIVETSTAKVGLHLNSNKVEVMLSNYNCHNVI